MVYDNRGGVQQPKPPAKTGSGLSGAQLWANAHNNPNAAAAANAVKGVTGAFKSTLGNVIGNNGGGRKQPAAPTNFAKPEGQGQPQPNQPNAMGYTATNAPYGVDQTQPGVGEQFWNQNQNMWFNAPQGDWAQGAAPSNEGQGQHQGAFGGPGQGSQFWNQVQGDFNKAGASLKPEFDKAYDRGRDNAVGAANQQAAARGAYGSSAALNNVGNVINDFEANRGKAHTDFMLADRAGQLDSLNSYGNLAFGAGKESLNTLNSAFGNSLAAQGARDGRLQGMFSNIFNQQNAIVPWAQGQYAGLMGNDQQAFGGAQDAALGRTQQAQNYATNARSNAESGLTSAGNLIGGIGQLANSGGPSGGGGASRGYVAPPTYGAQPYPGYNSR